jgi:hypothetical protein
LYSARNRSAIQPKQSRGVTSSRGPRTWVTLRPSLPCCARRSPSIAVVLEILEHCS